MFGSTNTKLWSGGTQYGYIMAEYPEGSQCQITRELDDKILKARGTSGNWAFALPEVIGLKVPKEYQEVEYLQSSGTQWIDTGYKFQPNIAIDIDFYWLALNYDTDIIGSDGSTGGICILLNRYNNNKNRAVINEVVEQWSSQEYVLNTLYSASIQSQSGTTNIVINGGAWNTLSQTVTSAYTLSLFGRNKSTGASNLATCRIYSCRITQGGTPVREFIPCYRKADSVAGMYDIVTQTFYTNQGTGTFITGPVVGGDEWTAYCTDGENEAEKKVNILYNGDIKSTELYYRVPAEYQAVEYIQSTGTQRITIPLETAKNVNALKMIADIAIMEQGSETGATIMGHVDTAPYWKFIDFRNATTIYPTCTTNGAVDGAPDPSLLNTRAELTFEGSNNTVNIYKADTLWYSGTRNARNISIISLLALYRGTGYTYICMAAKLYKLEIYDTDHTTLLKNCYPCYRKSDNVAGLWDEANKVFYTNAGTGTFVIGPDV